MLSIEKIFDMASKTYERTEEVRFRPIHLKNIEQTKKHLNTNDIILDYGCGTGTKALELAGSVKNIIGIDFSAKMIEEAKRKNAVSKAENVDFIRAVIFDERFQKESFDVITAFNVLHLLEDPDRVMHRITELLKPGGLFLSSTPCLGEKMLPSTKLQFSLVLMLMKLRLFPAIKRFNFSEVNNLITNAGFEIIETENNIHEMSSYFVTAKKI